MTERADRSSRRVFISYARADEAWAAWLADVLLRHQGDVVQLAVDEGTTWADAVGATIAGTDRVLVILSAASAASPWVRREIEHATAQGRSIIYMLVDQHEPAGLDAPSGHVVDARSAPLEALEQRVMDAISDIPAAPTHVTEDHERSTPSDQLTTVGSLASMFPAPVPQRAFIGRPRLTAALEQALLDDQPEGHSVALVGPRGSGKTVLAAKLVEDRQSRFDDVAWISPWSTSAWDISSATSAIIDVMARSRSRNTLIVIDDVADPTELQSVRELPPSVTLLLISQRDEDWEAVTGRRFVTIHMSEVLEPQEARQLVQAQFPDLKREEIDRLVDASGSQPLLLSVLARAAAYSGTDAATDALLALQRLITQDSGLYFLDTDDPRVISEWERAFQELTETGHEVDLAEFEQGSWRRSWRRRYTPERTEAVLDSAERAVEVAALARPEADANRNNAEAIARLIEASTAIPNLVVMSGSVLLIKVTDDRGARIVSKTLTATQLRSFEENEQLLSHPADALAFLAAADPPPRGLPERDPSGSM